MVENQVVLLYRVEVEYNFRTRRLIEEFVMLIEAGSNALIKYIGFVLQTLHYSIIMYQKNLIQCHKTQLSMTRTYKDSLYSLLRATARKWKTFENLCLSGTFQNPKLLEKSTSRLPLRNLSQCKYINNMSDDPKQQALAEKDLGNQAYKQRKFEEALEHYNKAWELDNSNMTILTNKAGEYYDLVVII